MSALTVTEIFKLVDDAPTKDAKLQLLKKYSNEAVKTLLVLNYHPTVKMDLPEGEPPYKKDETIPLGYSDTRDRKSTRLNSSHSQQSRMPSSA